MFLALEGVDCTGKSTVAQLLARSLDAVPYATPPRVIADRRELIDRDASPLDHYRFYLSGNRIASDEISELLSVGQCVVCDRYWLTTLVYHQVMGVSTRYEDFADLRQPAVTVLLTVSSQVQAERFLARGMSAGDRRMLNDQQRLAEAYREHVPLTGRYLLVDTDYMNPMEVASHIIDRL